MKYYNKRAEVIKGISNMAKVSIDRTVNTGGYCTVYHGFKDDKEVAVKVDFYDRFEGHNLEREAFLIKELDHPNLVKYVSHGKGHFNCAVPVHFLVEEFINGDSLDNAVYKEDFSMDKCLDFMIDICDFFSYLHENKWIMIDVKPESFILSDKGLKVIDLAAAQESPYDKHNSLACTFPFITPDIEKGFIDSISEIYTLGLVFYFMLSGKVPFEERANISGKQSIPALLALQKNNPIPFLNSTIPRELSDICMKMLSPSRGQRYYKVNDVKRDLESVC